MKKTNNKKGFWIDQKIMNDENLDCADRFILAEIYSLCKLPDGCYAPDKHFADLVNLSVSNINKRINRLKRLGYINTFIKTKNGKIEGKIITIKKKEDKNLVLQNIDNSISKTDEDVFQKNEISISKVEDEVLQNVEISISPVNINNTSTNTILLKQKIDQYTGEEIKIESKSLDNSETSNLEVEYEKVVTELFENSGIGKDIFKYASKKGIEKFKKDFTEDIFQLLAPLLIKFNDLDQKLYGKNNLSTRREV